MINIKDKELRNELIGSGVIRSIGDGFVQAKPIGPRIKELEAKLQAICNFLEIEVFENSEATVAPSHVAFKKNSPEARKHQKKKAARDLPWGKIVSPWIID